MSDFTTYNSIIEDKIANTSEVFYDAPMKRQAANDAVQEILQKYDIPEMEIRATLTLASGVGAIPSTFFRMVKIWEDDSNSVQLNEYQYVTPDIFDRKGATAGYIWTVDYNVSAAARKFLVKPTAKTSLFIRYIKRPVDMTSDSIDSGLSSDWDEAVAYVTTAKLMEIAGRYDEANVFRETGWKRVAGVYQAVKNPGGIKENNRLKSKFERVSQLGVNHISSINN